MPLTWCVSSVLWLMFDGTEACLYAGRVSVASRRCFMGVPWMVHEDLTSTCPLREAVPPLTIICHAVRMYDRSGPGMGVRTPLSWCSCMRGAWIRGAQGIHAGGRGFRDGDASRTRKGRPAMRACLSYPGCVSGCVSGENAGINAWSTGSGRVRRADRTSCAPSCERHG